MNNCWVFVSGICVVFRSICPANFLFSDFAQSKSGPRCTFYGELFVDFDFGEDVVGDGKVACF